MAESKAMFIHLFRDPDKFKTMSESPEWQKFQEKCHQRRRLFAEIGLKPQANLANFDGEFDKLFGVDTLYQKVHRDSQEFAILKSISSTGYERWPLQDCKHLAIPMEVLEEAKLVQQSGMFQELWIYCDHWSTSPALIVGRNEADCYPIVYWGPEEVFNEAHEKLKKLEETKNQPHPEVTAEQQKKSGPRWTTGDTVQASAVAATVLFLVGICLHAYYKEDVPAMERQAISIAEKEAAGQLSFHNAMHASNGPVQSVSDLPLGTVSDKLDCACRYCDGGRYYLVYIREQGGPTYERMVMKTVFNSLKIGDRVPLPNPKPKSPEEF